MTRSDCSVSWSRSYLRLYIKCGSYSRSLIRNGAALIGSLTPHVSVTGGASSLTQLCLIDPCCSRSATRRDSSHSFRSHP